MVGAGVVGGAVDPELELELHAAIAKENPTTEKRRLRGREVQIQFTVDQR